MVIKDLPPKILSFINFLLDVLVPFQLALLYLSEGFFYCYFLIKGRHKQQRKVAIGVTETARMIHFLGQVFPSRYTVTLDRNRYYRDPCDFGPYSIFLRPFIGPVLLAYLSFVCDTFLYISFTGYLARRGSDFKFLRKRGKKIVVLFCGSDIRSLRKTKEFFDARGEDSWVNYSINLHNDKYDDMVKRTAAETDQYANLIFNWNYDQIGYLEKPSIPWPYMLDIKSYRYEFSSYSKESGPTVIHCPSHTILKGTPLVRAALKKLQTEGYRFNYKELIGVPNSVVLEELGKSHIVLQEFYCITPGTLGVEALARGNAVLMAASHDINPDLPADSKQAWLATSYFQIYDHLKLLLEKAELVEAYAKQGREFIERHYALDNAADYYRDAFEKNNIPF